MFIFSSKSCKLSEYLSVNNSHLFSFISFCDFLSFTYEWLLKSVMGEFLLNGRTCYCSDTGCLGFLCTDQFTMHPNFKLPNKQHFKLTDILLNF